MNNLKKTRKKIKKIIDNEFKNSLIKGKKIFKKNENKKYILYYVFFEIIKCKNCSYRYMIYEIFNFNLSSYMILQLSGLIEIVNLEKKGIKCKKDNAKYKKGKKIFKSIEHSDRLNILSFIIYSFINNKLNKYNICFINELYKLYKKEKYI